MLACGMDGQGVMAEDRAEWRHSKGKGGSCICSAGEETLGRTRPSSAAQVSLGTGLAFANSYSRNDWSAWPFRATALRTRSSSRKRKHGGGCGSGGDLCHREQTATRWATVKRASGPDGFSKRTRASPSTFGEQVAGWTLRGERRADKRSAVAAPARDLHPGNATTVRGHSMGTRRKYRTVRK